MNWNTFGAWTNYSILSIIILCAWYIYSNADELYLTCVISSVDGNRYCVRDRKKVHIAADLLAQAANNMKQLVIYLKRTHPTDERVQLLVKRFNPQKLVETLPTSEFTAYSEQKGKKLAFCLNRKKDNNDKLIDIHTLTFVALHELAHVMTSAYGHKEVFWQNFKFILENAKDANIHIPADYKQSPKPYCGMNIDDNPYYDLH